MSINWSNQNLVNLRTKIQEDPKEFIAIVGAGVSAGLPDWKELKKALLTALRLKQLDEGTDNPQLIADIEKTTDGWDAFQLLQENLGPSYVRIMQEKLRTRSRAIPPVYRCLWELGISGIISFNIDKFAEAACSSALSAAPDVATGLDPYKYQTFINTDEPFVWHPHGEFADPRSWVFTRTERDRLYRDENFKKAMCAILNSKNILIIGFNSMEISFQTLLNDIGFDGAIVGYHNYILLNNPTPAETRQLNERGFRIVPYSTRNPEHPEVEDILNNLLNRVPLDPRFSTVYAGKTYAISDIPSVQHMLDHGCDALRDILNGVVSGIIPPDVPPTAEQQQALQEFYTNYTVQLYNAWMIDPKTEETNKLHGYTIKQRIGRGAFGNVYEAYDAENNKYAIKVLLPEVKDKFPYLNCFRRGIRSMRILKEHKLQEMVTIHQAYEIPACIIMDYIEGPTLREAIDRRMLQGLHKKLELIMLICRAINTAHQLPEQILHRDLKPENIILENYYSYTDDEPLSIKILDFDLSWHQGSTELTIKIGAMSQGFMAPEQADETLHDLTRNTAVDVYSIGMLIYFILTEDNPAPNQHLFGRFGDDLCATLRQKYRAVHWRSIPNHLSSLIVKATRNSQRERIALSVLIQQLEIAQEICIEDQISCVHPLFLQELAYRISEGQVVDIQDYGRYLTIRYEEVAKEIHLKLNQSYSNIMLGVEISKTVTSSDDRTKLGKYLETAMLRAVSATDRKLFTASGEVIQGAIHVNLAAKLPEKIPLKLIEQYAANIRAVRARMDLK